MSDDISALDAIKGLKSRLDLQIEARNMSQKEKDRKEKESLSKAGRIAREFKADLVPYLSFIRTTARNFRKQGVWVRLRKKFSHTGLTQTYRSRYQLVSYTRGYDYYSYKENDRAGGPMNENRYRLSDVTYLVEHHNTFELIVTLTFRRTIQDLVVKLYPAANRKIFALVNGYVCDSFDEFKLRVVEFIENH